MPIHQENFTILNAYVLTKKSSEYIKKTDIT